MLTMIGLALTLASVLGTLEALRTVRVHTLAVKVHAQAIQRLTHPPG